MKHTTVKRRLLAAAIPVVGLFAYANIAAAHGPERLNTELLGRNEVPGLGDPDGRGRARIFEVRDADTLCYLIKVSGIEPATAAHIHEGATDVAGPVVVKLKPPTSGSVRGCVSGLDEALVAEIFADPAEYYVNVHNVPFPGGAVRGQLS